MSDTELIKSEDQIEKSAKMELPTWKILQWSICHLFSIECNMSDTRDEMVNERAEKRNTDNAKETQAKVESSKRRAVIEARDMIYARHLIN